MQTTNFQQSYCLLTFLEKKLTKFKKAHNLETFIEQTITFE